jgi:hypothetical protein
VADESTDSARVLHVLRALGTPLSIKVYRLAFEAAPGIPVLPCLDHEAMLHETVAPHAAVYLQEQSANELHELVIFPSKRLILIDTVSTWGESSPAGCSRLRTQLTGQVPGYEIRLKQPSWWRGDRRVAAACRWQVTLRQVLLGDDFASISAGIERLRTIGMLMEKESRVASWGVRTVTGPLLAAAGFLTYQVLGVFAARLGEPTVALLRYGVIGILGAVFLYYGLKAVHLTGMSNRVWMRASEYGLILDERRRLAQAGTA